LHEENKDTATNQSRVVSKNLTIRIWCVCTSALPNMKRMKTRVTEMLGIKYPIVQGGMMWVGRAELAAAVSNAGGLGLLTALTQPTPDALTKEIERCRGMTDKPFGVNLTFTPRPKARSYMEYAQAIIDSGVKIVETAGNNPEPYVGPFKKAGITIIHKCTSVRHGLKAERLGCDIISMDGFECAGHPGEDDTPNFVLLPVAAAKLKVPMLASGGISNGQGLVAALALGAEGINMGTRFMATKEAPIHDNVKQAIVAGDERSSTHILRKVRNTSRIYRNSVALKIREIEAQPESTFEDIMDLVAGVKNNVVYQTGDLEAGTWTAGMVMGLINDIPTCKELLDRMVLEAQQILRNQLELALAG